MLLEVENLSISFRRYENKAQQILLQNMNLLHAIASELIAKEKINEEEFNKFFNM